MATIQLTCGHPANVTHLIGQRRVCCTVPRCGRADIVLAKPVDEIRYHNLTKLGALDDLVADLFDLGESEGLHPVEVEL